MLDFSRQHGVPPWLSPHSLTPFITARSLTLLMPHPQPLTPTLSHKGRGRNALGEAKTRCAGLPAGKAKAAFACAVVYDRGSQRKRERERPEKALKTTKVTSDQRTSVTFVTLRMPATSRDIGLDW